VVTDQVTGRQFREVRELLSIQQGGAGREAGGSNVEGIEFAPPRDFRVKGSCPLHNFYRV